MPLRFVDTDGEVYIFEDDRHAALVKRLVHENIQQSCRIMELETYLSIEKVLRHKAEQKNDEIILATINPLDPEKK